MSSRNSRGTASPGGLQRTGQEPGGRHGKAPPASKKAQAGLFKPTAPAPIQRAPRTQRKRYGRSELACTDSPYLCPACHELLYVDTVAMGETCLNRRCTRYTYRGEIFGDLTEHEGPLRAEELYRESIRGFHNFSQEFLFQKIHEARAVECSKLFKREGMNTGIVTSLDHLMMQLHGNTAWGASRDYRACRAAFDEYYTNFENLAFFEDILAKNYIPTTIGNPLVIKYQPALKEFFRAYGMFSAGDERNTADPLPFYHIDRKSMGDPSKSAFDLDAICDNSLPLASMLNYAFKMRRFTSKMHRYPARPEDLAALRSLWETCQPGSPSTVTAEELRKVYEGAVEKNEMSGDFDLFLEDYTSGKAHAPVVVFDGEKYRYDYPSLLLYQVYLSSNNPSRSGTQAETGRTIHEKNRQCAARHFEAEIRQKLRGDGFDVYPQLDNEQFKPSFDGKRREFDCIAVDRKCKIIVIVEAKCEGMAPSSMAAGMMVDQLALDKKTGLIAHAKSHHSRREFFRQHFDDLKRRGLDLQGSFSDYAVRALVVTKHEPLVSRYMDIDIISYKEFLLTNFRFPAAPGSLAGAVPEPARRPSVTQPAGRGGGTARPHRGAMRGRRG